MESARERINNFDLDPFLDGPTEFLVKVVAEQIRAVPQFKLIFGENIDPYLRMDYSVRSLPALRIYNENWLKEFESWFVTGDLTLDVILPPSIRRAEQQQLQDTIVAALVQQFRRTPFFNAVCELVPGLNELGKTFSADKTLGFKWEDGSVPLTQIQLNFRLDLRQWDEYLESQCRTKACPFERTLGELERIFVGIQAMRDDGSVELTIDSDIKV